jgi:cysteinyl-tRNA synthetase
MKVFGIYDEDVFPSNNNADQQEEGVSSASHEDVITPLMNALSKFRDTVKAQADLGPKELFRLCDELRDDILPHLSIRLEDRAKGQEAIWKYEDKAVLLKERADKLQEKERKEEEKRKRKEEETRKKSTPPTEWFKVMRAAEFSKYEADTGIPTHDAKDKEISESIRNKLKKEWNKQKEVYEKYLAEKDKNEESKQ